MTGPVYSVLWSKCAKCNVGNLYEDNNPYHLRKLDKMNKNCACCGQSFEPEVGFYYGAMYVSYALSILAMFIPGTILYVLFDVEFPIVMGVVLAIYVFCFPIFFRWSRNIWLNIFVRFDPEAHEKAVGSCGTPGVKRAH